MHLQFSCITKTTEEIELQKKTEELHFFLYSHCNWNRTTGNPYVWLHLFSLLLLYSLCHPGLPMGLLPLDTFKVWVRYQSANTPFWGRHINPLKDSWTPSSDSVGGGVTPTELKRLFLRKLLYQSVSYLFPGHGCRAANGKHPCRGTTEWPASVSDFRSFCPPRQQEKSKRSHLANCCTPFLHCLDSPCEIQSYIGM